MSGLDAEETGFLEPDEPAAPLSVTVARYRKTAVVEARYFDPRQDYDGACAVVAWCGGTATDEGCLVPTLEGPVLALPGYMIVKDERGNCWPVRGDLFAEDYEMVPDGDLR